MLQNNIIYSELNDWIIQYYSRAVIGFNDHSMRHYIACFQYKSNNYHPRNAARGGCPMRTITSPKLGWEGGKAKTIAQVRPKHKSVISNADSRRIILECNLS